MAKSLNKKYLFVIVALLIIVIVLNIIPGLASGLGNFVFKIFSPLEIFFIRTGDKVVGFFEVLLSIKDLAKENIELRKDNLELETELTNLKETDRENKALREALQITERGQILIDRAFVVGKGVQGPQDWILINRGSKHGVEENMAVVSKEMALVGRVAEVMSSFSKVMLITNKDSIVAAIIEGERNEGLVRREEKGKLFMDFIPRTEKLEIKERIITSGMDEIFPREILIGKIEDIDFSQNQLFQKIYITPAVNFSKLEEVFIVK